MANQLAWIILLQQLLLLTCISYSSTSVDLNDPYLQEIAEFAVSNIDLDADAALTKKLARIITAQTQEVDGLNYYLTIEVLQECKENSSKCPVNPDIPKHICEVVVWDHPDLKIRKLLENITQCEEREDGSPPPPFVVGGLYEEDVNSKTVQDIAKFAVETIGKAETAVNRELLNVIHARGQVVAGTKHYLTLNVTAKHGSETKSEVCEVEVVEVVWKNHREVLEHACFPVEQKKDHAMELAQEAFQKINAVSQSRFEQVLLNVAKTDTVVVPGSKGSVTSLSLETGYTFCLKRYDSVPQQRNCPLDSTRGSFMCNIIIWERPWKKDTIYIGSPSCKPKEEDTVTTEYSAVPVTEEIIVPKVMLCAGCPIDVDPTNPVVTKMSELVVAELDTSSGSDYQHIIVHVISAKRQVVAGIKYILVLEVGLSKCPVDSEKNRTECEINKEHETKICDAEVLERAWLNSTEVLSVSCHRQSVDSTQETEDSKVQKPLGAKEPVHMTDSSLIEDVAKFAVRSLDRLDDDNVARILLEVLDAEEQVVSGILYHITMKVGSALCTEDEVNPDFTCDLDPSEPIKICRVKVHSQPWIANDQYMKMTESYCHVAPDDSERRDKRSLLGGKQEADVDDDDVQKAAAVAVAALDEDSGNPNAQKLIKIISAKKQIVAGTLYYLKLQLGYTECKNTETVDRENCALKENQKQSVCDVKVWVRPWLKESKVTKVSCVKQQDRKKRNLKHLGGKDDGLINMGLFKDFIKKYNKTYPTKDEFWYRYKVFAINIRNIQALQDSEEGTAVYGVNQFADLTKSEFKKMYLGLRLDLRNDVGSPLKKVRIPDIHLPPDFDWRKYNAVTPVKNQGMCGSCWAFSVTGNVEGQWAVHHRKLFSLSEQELVDCDKLDDGCDGGLPENAYKSIMKLGGLETERDYPYDGVDENCHFNKTDVKVTIKGAVELSKNETKLAQWLVKNGPISIGINANAMQFYMGGISHPWNFFCNPDELDHGVLIVGYGVHNYPLFNKTIPFWSIKNSWGKSWGEQGYYRVYRGDGTCGLNQMATSAVVN